MALLRHVTRRVVQHIVLLEQTAASTVSLHSAYTQTAGLSSQSCAVHLPPSSHGFIHSSWHFSVNSSSSSSSSSSNLCSSSDSSSRQWQSQRSYSQCDCPTLGGPEPEVVVVEYDEEEVDRFIALADAIEAVFPNTIVEGNPEGAGRPGSFEVKDQAGQVLFSRLQSGGWPEADAVVDALTAAAACNTSAAPAEKAA